DRYLDRAPPAHSHGYWRRPLPRETRGGHAPHLLRGGRRAGRDRAAARARLRSARPDAPAWDARREAGVRPSQECARCADRAVRARLPSGALRAYVVPARARDVGRRVIPERWPRPQPPGFSLAQHLEMTTADKLSSTPPIRVLVAKPGLDGHDRGAKVVARALRDAGMAVIYTGIRQTPEMIAEAALQEDVDAVGGSILSAADYSLCPRIVSLLREQGMAETLVVLGGIVHQEDIPKIKEQGVAEIFLPGTSTQDIAEFIRNNVKPRD